MGTRIGLTGSVAMALGGMIGGGIYAVLGVVTQITGAAVWFAFAASGVVALCAGYSYSELNRIDAGKSGGSVGFVHGYVGNATLAGMVGWTLLFGYIGTMAMYAFAFGEFAVAFPGVPETIAGVGLRTIISVLCVAGFVGLNLLGARASSAAETLMVGVKVAVLAAFGLGGVWYVEFVRAPPAQYGLDALASFSPIMAAAVSFVAFEGWQLLFYDQESIDDPLETIPTAVYIAIVSAVAIYVFVGVATINLAPGALESNPHTALASAAETLMSVVGLGGLGFAIISLSALFSTGSAINATLFSTGFFAKRLVDRDLLPTEVGDPAESGVPERTLLWLGGITAALTAIGTLETITAFASLSFIIVFGVTSYIALRRHRDEAINPYPPAVGVVGAMGFFTLMFYHLYRAERGTFYAVVILAVGVLVLELLYFERDRIEHEVAHVESSLEERP